MAKISASYETIFIVNSTLGEDAIAATVEKFKGMIEQAGRLVKIDEWGKRRLAYPIEDMTEGYYVYISFVSEPNFPAELERVYGITDSVIRSIVVNIED